MSTPHVLAGWNRFLFQLKHLATLKLCETNFSGSSVLVQSISVHQCIARAVKTGSVPTRSTNCYKPKYFSAFKILSESRSNTPSLRLPDQALSMQYLGQASLLTLITNIAPDIDTSFIITAVYTPVLFSAEPCTPNHSNRKLSTT